MNTPKPIPDNSSQAKTTGPKIASSVNWQIPRGVSKGTWDYVRARKIAEGYDEFLLDDPLTKVDWQILNHYIPAHDSKSAIQAPLVADFGCGTGRSLGPIIERGYRGLGIDLSIPMLEKFDEKSRQFANGTEKLTLLNANLVELDGLKENSIDHGICMFSTLGMIAGSHNRATFLAHARRAIKPGGQFIVHAHNVWYQLRYPGGVRWMLSSIWSRLRCRSEFGDRTANYRNVNQLFIHSFRQKELGKLLLSNGFSNQTWIPIKPNSTEIPEPSSSPSMFSLNALKLVGWVVVCD